MLPRLDRPTRAAPTVDAPLGLSILGSTGSIGTQALEVVRLFPERFRVRALAAGSDAEALAAQAREFRPDLAALADERAAGRLREMLADTDVRVAAGDAGLEEAAAAEGAGTVVAAIVGFAGLRPTLAALRAGKEVALANKETLVVAGPLVERVAREQHTAVLPIDSEHSAVFQCLVGEPPGSVERLTLTASGGPFRTRPAETFDRITPAEALRHPNWSMGAKNTIDSATLMNKGLEVIEARWLFDVAPERIDVLVQPQSIVHALVAFRDGSVKAQLGAPDMRVPIQYALTFPERWPAPYPRMDWAATARLDFEEPDTERFPCLRLAFEALAAGGAAPAVLNAANEEAVALFLQEEAAFTDIPRLVERALDTVDAPPPESLEALEEADRAGRRAVRELRTQSVV